MKKLTRNKSLSCIIACCMLIISTITCLNVSAVEVTSTKPVDEIIIDFNNSGGISTYSSSEPFYSIQTDSARNVISYTFNVPKACTLKIMWVGQYVDGSTGTMQFYLDNFVGQRVDLPMDGTVRITQYSQKVTACQHTIYMWPDDVNKTYISVGQFYTTDY